MKESYYVTRTLLGGTPDVNRRIIYDAKTHQPIWCLIPKQEGWSADDEAALQAELQRLNDPRR